jgi:hypothetical protein
VGGSILALPLAVLLYLLLFPTKPPDPDDFFDDDEDSTQWATYGTYAVCAALILTLGSISGALGTVCLSPSLMLTAAEAAAAGIVGAIIICAGLACVALFACLIWLDYFRPKSTTTTTEER